MALNEIVQVSISIEKAAIIAQGFGVPMILDAHTKNTDAFRIYTDLPSLVADGFVPGDAAYKAAAEILSQANAPITFLVGRRTANVAQINTITPTAVNLAVYTVTIDGTAYTYTAETPRPRRRSSPAFAPRSTQIRSTRRSSRAPASTRSF